MGDHPEKPSATVGQFVVSLLGVLLIPGLVIFLIIKLVLGIQANFIDDSDQATVVAATLKNIAPVGAVALKGEAPKKTLMSGEQIVNKNCIACHGAGVLGSPKIGDAAAWASRISQGYETLVKNAITGIRTMPARGGNANLSDLEVAAAVVYMANKSGADFETPTMPEVAPVNDMNANNASMGE